jgi:hypothetical protein
MTDLIDRLPDPDRRRAVADLITQYDDIVAEQDRLTAHLTAERGRLEEAINAERQRIHGEYDVKISALRQQRDIEIGELVRSREESYAAARAQAGAELARIDAIDAEIEQACASFLPRFQSIDDALCGAGIDGVEGIDDVTLCALTGLPVFDDDALLRDEDTGETYLRAALIDDDAEAVAVVEVAA